MADNYDVKDAAGATKTKAAKDIGGGVLADYAYTRDGDNVALGAKADAAASDSTSAWSVVALLKGLYALLAGVLKVGGQKVAVTGTFTRPADTTAYAAGDAVGNSTSALTVITLSNFARVSGGSGYIVGARLVTNLKSITPRFRVHLLNASNPTLSNDNAAYQSKYADFGKRIGSFDLPAMSTPSDTTNSDVSGTADMTIRIPFVAVGTRDIYYVLEALDAFPPASGQSFSLQLVGELD